MSKNHRDGHDNRDQEDRIDELKRQAEQAAGGEVMAWESDALPAEKSEQFWRRVMAFETAPTTTNFQQLTEAGLTLPEPDAMTEEELTSKVGEVLDALAGMRVFVSETDHLSDRQLYTKLWHDVLREEVPMMPDCPGSAWHVNLTSGGSEMGTHLYLKYYADENWRQQWREEFPDYDMPAHEDPPHDRDRHLRQADEALH